MLWTSAYCYATITLIPEQKNGGIILKKDNKNMPKLSDLVGKHRIRSLAHVRDFNVDFEKSYTEFFRNQPEIDAIIGPGMFLATPNTVEEMGGINYGPFMGDLNDFWRMMQGLD